MADLPYRYETRLKWKEEAQAGLSAQGKPDVLVGPPPEFGGGDSWWSPELLFVAAVEACFMTTFMAVAKKSKLAVLGYESRAEGTLDKTAEGLLFTEVTLRPVVKVSAQDAERVGRLLELAKKHCLVSASLKTPVTVKSLIQEA
ncbi:MAG TPA: OsmC family protein [Elusimicrobiota bacterium]|nr:OsmC family protein [Elusimicrobiota bacterium]